MTNPDPIFLTIFGKDIYWYGITMACGVVFGLIVALRSAKVYRWKADDILDFVILAIPLGLICARAYYVIFEWQNYAADPIRVFYIWEGGLALYGSLIGALLAAVIYCKWKKKTFGDLIDLLDIGAPSFALGQAIGRWGNFFNQEAYGIQVTNPAHMWFPMAVKIDATNTIHYATFFYESMWCLALCAFLLLTRKKFRHKGDVLLTYIMLYGFERMFVEGLRTDSLYIWGTSIRVSQALAFAMFAVVAIYFIARLIREKKHGVVITQKANPRYVWDQIEPEAPSAARTQSAEEPVKSEEVTKEEEINKEDV